MLRDLVLQTHNGNVRIGATHKTFIIAEIGQNHQGDFEFAKRLIQSAKDAGADCVKFQKSSLTERFTAAALASPYVSENSWGATYGEHRSHLEFSEQQIVALNDYAKEIGILFSSSVTDLLSLEFIQSLNPPFIKIGSGDSNNYPLLQKAASLKIPLIISTGMQNMRNIETIYTVVSEHHNNFVLMHCVSAYPTNPEDLHLNTLHTFQQKFPGIHFGYSGHEETSIADYAVAAGARVIERHLTMDKTLKGSDHTSSSTPEEFYAMVLRIRHIEKVMGSPDRTFFPCEAPCRLKLGKSLVAARNLARGEILRAQDIAIKATGNKNISADFYYKFIGLKVIADVETDEPLTLSNIQETDHCILR